MSGSAQRRRAAQPRYRIEARLSRKSGGRPAGWWRLFAAVNSPAAWVPGISLCGRRLLGDRVVGFVISDAVESLAVELGEPDAVGLVSDQEIENGPDEREAAVLAGEAAP
jgi:hypothetical protein